MESKMIEISLETYNVFVNRALKYDLLKKAVASSIRKYVSSDGLYVDNELIRLFQILCPVEWDKRVEELRKEGDVE